MVDGCQQLPTYVWGICKHAWSNSSDTESLPTMPSNEKSEVEHSAVLDDASDDAADENSENTLLSPTYMCCHSLAMVFSPGFVYQC